MALKSSRVVSSSSCPVTRNVPVTITCPAPTAVFPTPVAAGVEVEVEPVIGPNVNALLAQLGLSPTAVSPAVFPATNPLSPFSAVNPFAALAANNPVAALAALSPVFGLFNAAVNSSAALPGCPPDGVASKLDPACLPFGNFFKPWCKALGI